MGKGTVHEAAGHMQPAVRKQGEEANASAQLAFSFSGERVQGASPQGATTPM